VCVLGGGGWGGVSWPNANTQFGYCDEALVRERKTEGVCVYVRMSVRESVCVREKELCLLPTASTHLGTVFKHVCM